MSQDFVHLHLHSQYSLLDGAADIKKLIQRAKSLGQSAVALTDHGSMYGTIDFYNEAKRCGIKPIIGCEVYTAPQSRFDKFAKNAKPYGHLVLLCKNEVGYKNLLQLVTKANTEGFYYKPRVDMQLLEEHSEGLIALSACIRGDVPMAYLGGTYPDAKDKALEFIKIFGKENFFLEIQNHGLLEEEKVREGLVRLSKELGLGLVATNDVHYVDKEDSLVQDVLSCIQTGKKLSDDDRMKMIGDEYYLKSGDEMHALFSDTPSAIANTLQIADRCNLEIDMSSLHLPKIDIKSPLSHKDYLLKLCTEGLSKKYKIVDDSLKSRLRYELDTINSMGYADYFLIVCDLISYAKTKGIPIGPGRGSAAGSLVSYVLDITEIDPIANGLIFERFLNPERISMPDIDIDICYERRDELRDYVSSKYGSNRVAQIVTFGTMAAKAAIKDVARVLGLEISLANKISKLIPNTLHITLSEALESTGELREMYTASPEIKRLVDIAMAIEGFPRHTSTHAAGVVIGDDDLSRYVPLQDGDGALITQYPMSALEQIGLLKMDFLGLRNLTIIKDSIELINKEHRGMISADTIPLCDSATFDMISRGDTDALFQLENPGLQSFLRKFKPKSIDDIVLTTSIYRPGPMEQIPLFLKNVKNPEKIEYKHPLLEPILKPTYGVVIYQEQVMAIVRSLAGYSMGRADLVRRAMSKKKLDIMQRERDIFVNGYYEDGVCLVEGAKKRGISEDVANEIFDSLYEFAKYAFNKSHAACYALVAYRTAYLKCHYPDIYLASVLKNYLGHTEKAIKYISSFKKYGIKLLGPDVNKSYANFTPEDGNIRFGLGWIKGVGTKFPDAISKERQNGYFKSFADFIKRMCYHDISKRSVEAMIKCGSFDSLYPNRQVLLFNCERLIDEYLLGAKAAGRGQVSWLSMEKDAGTASEASLVSEEYEDFSFEEKLLLEYEGCGMYFSGHPMMPYAFMAEAYSETSIEKLSHNVQNDGKKFVVCGIISDASVRYSKGGKQIFSAKISDFSASCELIAFESVYVRHRDILQNGTCIAATVICSADSQEDRCDLILNGAVNLKDIGVPKAKTLYVRLNSSAEFEKLKNICRNFQGDDKLCVYIEDIGKMYTSDKEHGIVFGKEVFDKILSEFGIENVKIK